MHLLALPKEPAIPRGCMAEATVGEPIDNPNELSEPISSNSRRENFPCILIILESLETVEFREDTNQLALASRAGPFIRCIIA